MSKSYKKFRNGLNESDRTPVKEIKESDNRHRRTNEKRSLGRFKGMPSASSIADAIEDELLDDES